MNNSVDAIVISGGDVYAGGLFSDAGGDANADRIAKFSGGAWSPLGSGLNCEVLVIAISGGDVYAGGCFTDAGGDANADRIAKFSGGVWSALGTGLSNTVNAIAISGSDVYAGGVFTDAGGDANADRIAKFGPPATPTPTPTTASASLPASAPSADSSMPREEDFYEPDNSLQAAHAITGPELHNFCSPANHEDWVKFVVPSGWTIHVKAAPPQNYPTEPHLDLFAPISQVASNDHYFGNIAEIWFWNNGPEATFYVRVTELRGRAGCGASEYTLSVELIRGPASSSPFLIVPPNSSPAPANPAPGSNASAINPPRTPTSQTIRNAPRNTATPPPTQIAIAIPQPTRTIVASTRLDKTSASLGSRGGTVSNAMANVRVLLAPEALREDALVTLRALKDAETNAFNADFLLLGRGVNASIADARGNLIFDLRGQPMSVCFAYTPAQFAQARARVENLAIVANLGQEAESELSLNRVVYPEAKQICADASAPSTFALVAREPRAASPDLAALARNAGNVLALVLLGGAGLFAALAGAVAIKKR